VEKSHHGFGKVGVIRDGLVEWIASLPRLTGQEGQLNCYKPKYSAIAQQYISTGQFALYSILDQDISG
jgi:hypothetical protein